MIDVRRRLPADISSSSTSSTNDSWLYDSLVTSYTSSLQNVTSQQPTSLPPPPRIFGNSTTQTPHMSPSSCVSWSVVDNVIFQAATACLTLAILASGWRKAGELTTRSLFIAGWSLVGLWAGCHLCSMDTIIWSGLLVGVNVLMALRHMWKLQRARAGRRKLGDFYRKHLQPLGVDRLQLQQLMCRAHKSHMPAGHLWADQGRSQLTHSLSLLLSGRMEVLIGEEHVHYINPSEFINSLEWDLQTSSSVLLRSRQDSVGHAFHGCQTQPLLSQNYQVTIRTMKDCVFVTLEKDDLHHLLLGSPSLYSALRIAVGKDITQKVYRVIEKSDNYIGSKRGDANKELVSFKKIFSSDLDSFSCRQNQTQSLEVNFRRPANEPFNGHNHEPSAGYPANETRLTLNGSSGSRLLSPVQESDATGSGLLSLFLSEWTVLDRCTHAVCLDRTPCKTCRVVAAK